MPYTALIGLLILLAAHTRCTPNAISDLSDPESVLKRAWKVREISNGNSFCHFHSH